MSYTPAQVAAKAHVSAQSVRNWGKEYSEFLSPGASGQHGARIFTDEDLDVLLAVAALRRSGVPPAEIPERLRDNSVPPVIDVVQTALQAPQESAQSSENISIALYNALQSRLEAVERSVAEQAAQRRQMAAVYLLGILSGIAFVIVLFLAFERLGQ
jgi:DNA-binding transcriptional MerR regulator